MKRKTRLFILFFIGLLYRKWFVSPAIIGGDWPYYFAQTLQDFSIFPPVWAPVHGNGLGGEVVLYSLDSYVHLLVWLFVHTLHIPWESVYKVFIFGLFILLSVVSSGYLFKTILVKTNNVLLFISALIFTTNTYILMVVGGGQMGVALAYSLAPLVLGIFIRLVNQFHTNALRESNVQLLRKSLIGGLVLAMQMSFDARFAYITLITCAMYLLFIRWVGRISFFRCVTYCLVMIGVSVALNAFWIFPLAVNRSSIVTEIITRQTSTASFRFFSFAHFSDAFSALHPNWPENIFGKVYFMRVEFLFAPLVAWCSVLFMDGKKRRKTVLFFTLLMVLGAFLAKGAQEPFGIVNEWMYEHVPGFTMFRDPTKFYVFAVLAYAILIPYSLLRIGELFGNTRKRYIPYMLFIIYWLLLLRPVWMDKLGGTFQTTTIPEEYNTLTNYFHGQTEFFRILWVPRQERLAYYSYNHPAVEATTLFGATNSAQLVDRFNDITTKDYLEQLSIKYIVIPYDVYGDIFVRDQKPDETVRQLFIEKLSVISWLKKRDVVQQSVIFETENQMPKFWTIEQTPVIYTMISPTKYSVSYESTRSSTLIFNERYSQYWKARVGNTAIQSIKTSHDMNSFALPIVHMPLYIYFEQERAYTIGRTISFITLIAVFVLLGIWKIYDTFQR